MTRFTEPVWKQPPPRRRIIEPATSPLRHGCPRRIAGWARVRRHGERFSHRRFLRLEHYVLTVWDGPDEYTDHRIFETVPAHWRVEYRHKHRQLVVDGLVASFQSDVEFYAWCTALEDGTRDPAMYYDLAFARKIAEGAFGTVLESSTRATGEIVAVKVVDKSTCPRSVLAAASIEARAMLRVRHPAIIRCFDVFDGPQALHIVMEYAPDGTLESYLKGKRATEVEAIAVLRRLLSALSYLAAHGIVHRDLKPENILVGPGSDSWSERTLVSDFGLAALMGGERAVRGVVGTMHHLAPEMLPRCKAAGKGYEGGSYGPEVDVWAAGIVAYWLLSGGLLPFDGEDCAAICRAVRGAQVSFDAPEWDHVSDEAKAFVRSLLHPVPHTRLSADGALQHRWLSRKWEIKSEGRPPKRGRARLRAAAFAVLATRRIAKGSPQYPMEIIDDTSNNKIRRNSLRNGVVEKLRSSHIDLFVLGFG